MTKREPQLPVRPDMGFDLGDGLIVQIERAKRQQLFVAWLTIASFAAGLALITALLISVAI